MWFGYLRVVYALAALFLVVVFVDVVVMWGYMLVIGCTVEIVFYLLCLVVFGYL